MKPAFQRRHYEVLAREIRAAMDKARDSAPLRRLTARLAERFAKDNPNFDSARWFAACGMHAEDP